MKLIVRHAFHDPENDDVDVHSERYNAAHDLHQRLADRNTKLYSTGGTPSAAARQDEERARDELDCARHALFDATALAYPTLH
jgi:hypothetical protein